MITLVNKIEEANAITHAGTFHADDVFSSIFLSKFKEIKLYRAKEISELDGIKDKIVFDIGYQEFDHHGPDAKIRDNGLKYSALGLLFEHYGYDYFKKKKIENVKEIYDIFLKDFIMQIDAIDNGVFPSNPKDYNITSLSQVIEWFNVTWKERIDNNEQFLQACYVAELIWNRIEQRILDKYSAKKRVEASIIASTNHILLLEEYMPFMDFLLESKHENAKHILFAIFPSNRGGYNIRTINKELGTHQNRLDFPKEWGGKTPEELKHITNIATFRFCHPNLFLCSCDTLEDAYQIAFLAINQK